MVQQPSASSQGGVKKASTAAPEQASVVSVSASADDAKPAPTAQAVAANSAGEFAGDKQISSDGADGNTEATVTADGPQEPEVSGAERSGMHTHMLTACVLPCLQATKPAKPAWKKVSGWQASHAPHGPNPGRDTDRLSLPLSCSLTPLSQQRPSTGPPWWTRSSPQKRRNDPQTAP